VVVCNWGENYFQTSLVTVARKRVVWLFVLLTPNTVTGTIIKSQEDILEKLSHWQRLFLCLSARAACGFSLQPW